MLKLDYVPEPKPVTSDYTVACHYYPGWSKNCGSRKNGFDAIQDFPERTPLMGYYDEADPEVTDWEIKWAVEHGINCFVYCWYRKDGTMGTPVTRDLLHLGHAIHDGLFHAKYQKYIQFAIMWECGACEPAKDSADLTENLLPFWVNEYFSKENYLKIDGKPIVFVYGPTRMVETIGSEENCRAALEACNEKIREYGFPGIHFSTMENGWNKTNIPFFQEHGYEEFSAVEKSKRCGFDSGFQYNWHYNINLLSPEQRAEYEITRRVPEDIIVDYQLASIRTRVEHYPDYFMYTASVMWDRTPWYPDPDPNDIIAQFQLSPENWRKLLKGVREIIETLPQDSIGRKIVMIDNWNEWAEGHYVSPCAEHGFGYLQAIREELTHRDNLPDYRLPSSIGRGPYLK